MINLDRAYCKETDSVLTIYQVRDLHFDEESDFNARKVTFECPDEDCDAPLIGVNHTKAEFKTTPHFRLLKNHKHADQCDIGNNNLNERKDEPKERQLERSHKVSDHPEVLLLERQPTPYSTGKLRKNKKAPTKASADQPSSVSTSEKPSPHETSCLEHVVETWESNTREELSNSLLTIGDKTKWYRNAFKFIDYFADEKGLIYWGNVKSIKKYGYDYAIKFREQPVSEGKNRQISIYLSAALIESYRKRKLFRRYIESLIEKTDSGVRCYFVGAYPKLKEKDVDTPYPYS